MLKKPPGVLLFNDQTVKIASMKKYLTSHFAKKYLLASALFAIGGFLTIMVSLFSAYGLVGRCSDTSCAGVLWQGVAVNIGILATCIGLAATLMSGILLLVTSQKRK